MTAEHRLYDPIEPGTGFRVLVLHPASKFDDDIVCSLIPATITEFPPYEALSYVWGSDQRRSTVTVQGRKVSVTPNLESALRHLRLHDKHRNLWVDALCIDQTNIQERNNHVQYMTEVYAKCTSDLLWLGQDDAIIKDGWEVMNHFGTLMTLDQRFHDMDREQYKALSCLFAATSVWKRVWIMQEVAYAPRVVLVAGKSTLLWEEIEAFFDTDEYIKKYHVLDAYHAPFSHEFSVRSMFNRTLTYAHILAQQRRIVQATDSLRDEGSSPMDVLSRFRFTDATDPRDKVIALLGMTSGQLNVPIDYAAPVQDLYINVTVQLMKNSGNLDLLCQGPWQLHGRHRGLEGLPSWVPDFSNPGDSQIVFAQRDIFNAAGKETKFDVSVSNGTLKLTGYLLGKVSVVNIHFLAWFHKQNPRKNLEYPAYLAVQSALFWMPKVHREEGIRQGNISLKTFPKGVSQEPPPARSTEFKATYEAYWRTLMMDCMRRPTRRINSATDLESLQNLFTDFRKLPVVRNARSDVDLKINNLIDRTCEKWRFATTSNGLYCMVPPQAQTNDIIVVVDGARTPIVLRPTADGKHHWVAACYVHDFMDGQILATSTVKTTFEIV